MKVWVRAAILPMSLAASLASAQTAAQFAPQHDSRWNDGQTSGRYADNAQYDMARVIRVQRVDNYAARSTSNTSSRNGSRCYTDGGGYYPQDRYGSSYPDNRYGNGGYNNGYGYPDNRYGNGYGNTYGNGTGRTIAGVVGSVVASTVSVAACGAADWATASSATTGASTGGGALVGLVPVVAQALASAHVRASRERRKGFIG